MSLDAVLLEYQTRIHALQIGMAQARSSQASATIMLAAAFGLFFVLGFLAMSERLVPVWYPTLSAPLAFVSARRCVKHHSAWLKSWRLERFYQRGVARLRGLWPGTGVTGEEFIPSCHLYGKDLNVCGEGSLFELLCTARTGIGRQRLAQYLLQAPSPQETRARQEAIQELRSKTALREKVALLGQYEFQETNWETFANWLKSPAMPIAPLLRLAAFMAPLSLIGVFLTGIAGLFPWSLLLYWIVPLVLLQSALGLAMRGRIHAMTGSLRLVGLESGVFREGLELLGRQSFRSEKLGGIIQRIENGQAAREVRKLERLVNAFNERDKEWFYHISRLLLCGTQLCMAIEHWREEKRAALEIWLDAWAEFEALNALGAYAYEHPADTFPQLIEDEPQFEAHAIGHPLLEEKSCIRNDLNMNAAATFYLVSGSNMAGKSTLLRAIGLNAVLAFAGAPVRAQSLRISPFSICASLSVVDSLLTGKSKFLCEVERLRQTIDAAKSRPVLFLIDEMLSGTNSRDRRIAAESIIRTLVRYGALGALSTHDLALTEIADVPELRGLNVHMGSRCGDDPMDFDFLVKPGVTTEANALAIAQLAGVPV